MCSIFRFSASESYGLPPKMLRWATKKNDKCLLRQSSANRCQLQRKPGERKSEQWIPGLGKTCRGYSEDLDYITTGRKWHGLGLRSSFSHEGLNNRNLSKEQKLSHWYKTYDLCFNWTIKTSHSPPKHNVSESALSTVSRRRPLLSEVCLDSQGHEATLPRAWGTCYLRLCHTGGKFLWWVIKSSS